MFTVDDAKAIAAHFRPRFADEQAFEESWTRYFATATVPDQQRLEAWLTKDLAKDEIRHAGIVSEPLLPVRQRFHLNDEITCDLCKGKRYVRRDLDIDHPDFGKAVLCPRCGGR